MFVFTVSSACNCMQVSAESAHYEFESMFHELQELRPEHKYFRLNPGALCKFQVMYSQSFTQIQAS